MFFLLFSLNSGINLPDDHLSSNVATCLAHGKITITELNNNEAMINYSISLSDTNNDMITTHEKLITFTEADVNRIFMMECLVSAIVIISIIILVINKP